MIRPSPLLPAARVFACELPGSTDTFAGGIFVVGVLTEKIMRAGKVSALRVSDPTGVFSFSMSWHAAPVRVADALEEPCFVAVYAGPRRRAVMGKVFQNLLVQALEPATREARDTWISDAASMAEARLQSRPDAALLQEKIAAAAAVVKPVAPAVELTDEQIFEVIERLSEKNGTPLMAVIAELQKLGMSETVVKAKLQKLADDGDLYSPVKGNIKVL